MSFLAHYVSHPEVVIDPAVPVPQWGLSATGRARAEAAARLPWMAGVARIVASEERKAIETAEILAAPQGLSVEVKPGFHENDRSATGFLPPPEFEATADLFFAHPDTSIRGWETAREGQRRILAAVAHILAQGAAGAVVFVGHGGVGTLLHCALANVPIARIHDQPGGGGNRFAFPIPSGAPLGPWQAFDR